MSLFRFLIILFSCIVIFIYGVSYIFSKESTILKIVNFMLKQDLSKPEVIDILNSISNIISESIQYNLLKYDVTGSSEFLRELNSILKYSNKTELKDTVSSLIKKYDA